MAFIRSIKQDFFSSGSITKLTPYARLFYIATWLEADREGRFKWDAGTLKNRYFPAETDGQCDIDALGKELEDAGLIQFYADDHKCYAWIPTFKAHQVINNRERESVLPSPQDVFDSRKGKERKGKERKERESRVTTPLSRVKETAAPKEFPITTDTLDWAKKKYGDIPMDLLNRERDKFLLYHESKASKFSSWDAALKNWITNWFTKYGGKDEVHTGKSGSKSLSEEYHSAISP